jgi:hypothetical protein
MRQSRIGRLTVLGDGWPFSAQFNGVSVGRTSVSHGASWFLDHLSVQCRSPCIARSHHLFTNANRHPRKHAVLQGCADEAPKSLSGPSVVQSLPARSSSPAARQTSDRNLAFRDCSRMKGGGAPSIMIKTEEQHAIDVSFSVTRDCS